MFDVLWCHFNMIIYKGINASKLHETKVGWPTFV